MYFLSRELIVVGLLVACFLAPIVYLTDGSAQTIARVAILK